MHRAPFALPAEGSGPVPLVAAYDFSGRLSGQPRWVEQGQVNDLGVLPGNIGRIMHAPSVVLVQPRRSQSIADFRVSAGAFRALDLQTGDLRYVLDNETDLRAEGVDSNRWMTESAFNLVDAAGALYTVRMGAFGQDLEGNLEEGNRSQFVRLNAQGEVVWRVTEYRLARALGLGDRLLGMWSDDDPSLSNQGFWTADIASMTAPCM